MSEAKKSTSKVQPIPEGYHTVTPFLTCDSAAREIDFLKAALGAEERCRVLDPDTQRVCHAELSIGSSVVMLSDKNPSMGCKSFKDLGGSPVGFYIYVQDVDAAFARATKAGGEPDGTGVSDMFWGDRIGTFHCPEGYQWTLATHTRDLTPEQIAQGQKEFVAAMMAEAGQPAAAKPAAAQKAPAKAATAGKK